MIIDIAELGSPIGRITVAVRDGRLCALSFTDRWPRQRVRLAERFPGAEFRPAANPAGVVGRLRDYFAGDLAALAAIAIDPGGTAFQRRVWSRLRRIPPGRTVSYGELAQAINAPRAVRAVGAANGANPVGIVVPCHRVIAAGGKLGGYGGGLARKRWLLAHEGARFRG